METLVINGDDSTDMKLLLTLAQKLGLSVKKLTRSEAEDWNLAQQIKDGMKSENVSRAEVMKALGKWKVKPSIFTLTHASKRAVERGATQDEIIETVSGGEEFPAKFGRMGFRKNFGFDSIWNGKHYSTKQIEAYSVEEWRCLDGNNRNC